MRVLKCNTLTHLGMIAGYIMMMSTPSAHAESLAQCASAHQRAMTACAAYEHTPKAETLEIVSVDTRTRVIATQHQRLENIQAKCERAKNICSDTCANAMENSILVGDDLSTPLNRLQDCEQGEVSDHLQKISDRKRKLEQLRQASY